MVRILWIPVFTGMTAFYDFIKNDFMKKRLEELVVQEFPYRCPYCDQEVSYEKIKLRVGENAIECPSCQRGYIKVVAPSLTEGVKGAKRLRQQ
ncbi:MAG: hypothetical protein KG012_02665 [Deltaproteobacteria bacterium]|nr:hypothetical protein [Deltaproteobacteria bacterium]